MSPYRCFGRAVSKPGTPPTVLHVLAAAAAIVALSGTAKATAFDLASVESCGAACGADGMSPPRASGGQIVGTVDDGGHYFIGHSSISAGNFSPFVGGFPRFVAADFSGSDLRAIASTFYDEPDLTLSSPVL